MKQKFAPLVGAAMMAALAGCSANTNIAGGIAAVDAKTHTITLYSGSAYQFDANADLSAYKPGDDVSITFALDATGKKNLASRIVKIKI